MFCSHCGIGDAQESICDNCVAEKDVNEVIKRYFHRGYPYDAIVGLLKKREGLQMWVKKEGQCKDNGRFRDKKCHS